MKKSALSFAAMMLLGLAIIVVVFGKVLEQPNSFLFSTSEDGVKSYYNFSYYLKYDQGIRHDGINYPYGDHLQYINSHPLYVQVLKFIDKHLFPLAEDGVGILNLSMIFSLWLALPFLFLVLRKFALPPWYAAWVSLIILFLSPQMDRIGGHFEMVYAFFIPMYWYFLLRWEEGRRRWLWSGLMLLTALVGGFTSAYIVAFLAVFPLAVLLVRAWLNRRDLRRYAPTGIYLLLLAIAPLVIVKGLVSVTDWVDDRPDNPWGFFIFHSNIWGMLLPNASMLREVLNGVVNFNYVWEGRAYVGFPPLLLVLGTALYLIYSLLGGRKGDGQGLRFRGVRSRDRASIYLAAGVVVLLFAMCIPFKWFRFLPELLPPLKQFRCLGRFSWIFYYIFSVFTALFMYRHFRMAAMKGKRTLALVVLTLLLGYWSLEAGQHLRRSTKRIFNSNTLITFHGNELEKAFSESGARVEDYQAILFLPFANTCGDKLLFTRGMHAFSQAMKCGYQTGIPLIQSFSPRLSFTHAMSSIQLLADTRIYKTRVEDMDQRDILIVSTAGKRRDQELNSKEAALLSRSDSLWTGTHFDLHAMPVENFNWGHAAWLDMALDTALSLPPAGPDHVRSHVPGSQIIFEDFETLPDAPHAFQGKGARYLKEGRMELLNESLFERYGKQELELSFWLFTDHRTHNMPTAEWWTRDSTGKLQPRTKLESRAVHDVDGLWVRISHRFRAEEGKSYQLTVRGKYVSVDNLLLRPSRAHVAIVEDGIPMTFDNFRLEVEAIQ